MTKTKAKKIMKWSAIALIVPILGQLFVEGWNWGLGDFAFTFVFFRDRYCYNPLFCISLGNACDGVGRRLEQLQRA